MQQFLQEYPLILMEAAIVERLRRSSHTRLDITLLNAPMIYAPQAAELLTGIYQEYIDIASSANLPLLLCTPTWRASHSRVVQAKTCLTINEDAAAFMLALKGKQKKTGCNIKIGGMIGCKNDCYQPAEGLGAAEAQAFHSWQIQALTRGGVDFLIAETLPSVHEALGIANAMAATGLPYIISFVISREGLILDGYRLEAAIDLIDEETQSAPLGYMVNCAYPSFLQAANQPKSIFKRLIGFQANASALDHCELDGACQLHTENMADWGDLMLELNATFGIKILGGCCGTDADYLRYLAANNIDSFSRFLKNR